MSFFKRILTPPFFDDEIKTQQAYMLHIILWTLLIIPIPYFIFSIFATPESMLRVVGQVSISTSINIILFIMLRRGYVNAAAIIQTSAFWLFFILTALTGSGVQGESYLIGSLLIITTAGILLGGKGAATFTFLSLAAGAFMVYQQMRGVISSSYISSPLGTWFVSIILFSVGAVLQHLAYRRVKTALNHARISEERYRLISKVSSDYTFSTALDADGNMYLSWVAGAFEEITGYTYAQYVASGGWLAHLHPDDVEQDARDMVAVHQNKRVITEIRTLTKNQEPRWVRVYAHPIWDDKQNKLAGIIGAVQDITEHKKVAEREASHQASLEKVLELGKHVTESKDLRTTYKRIWHAIRHDLGFDRLGIYIYDAERNFMDGTFGTSIQGEMVDETQMHISLDENTLETIGFLKAIKNPNGIYFTHRYDAEHDIAANPVMRGVKDYAAVAAWSGSKPVGVLCVDNAVSQQPISDEQLEALRLFASYAGLAIENSRLNEALQHELIQQKDAEEKEASRRAMVEKVVILGQKVTEVYDTRTVLENIWHGVRDVLGFDRLAVFLLNRENNSMDSMIGTDINGSMQDTSGISFPVSNMFKMVLEKPDGMFVTHNYDVEYNIPKGHEMYGVKDYAAVAAWAGDKPTAVLSVDQLVSGRRITDIQLSALRLFAGYVGLALENSRLHEALRSELDQQILAEEKEASRRTMLEKVVTIGKQVTEVINLKTTIERIWHAVHDDLDLDRVGIYFYNDENKSLDMALGTDKTGNMDKTTVMSLPMKEWRSFKKVTKNQGNYYFTQNYSLENNLPKSHEMYGVKEHAMFAAWVKDKPVAIIVVDNNITQRPITEHLLEALQLFIGYVGLAIENSHLHEALQSELDQQILAEENEASRRAMLEKVVVLGQKVTEVSNLRTSIERIWHGIHDELGLDRLAIFLYDQKTNTINGTLGTGNDGNVVEEWDYQRTLNMDKPTSFTRALEQTNGLFFTDNFGAEFDIPEGHEMHNVKDFAAVSAWAGDKPVAIITVDNEPSGKPITHVQLEALQLFAGYAGLAIENSRLNEALESELNLQKLAEEKESSHRAMLEKIVRLGQFVTERQDLRTTLYKIWQSVHHDLDFDRPAIFLYDPEQNVMNGSYGTNRDGEMAEEWNNRIHLDESSVASTSLKNAIQLKNKNYITHNYQTDNNMTDENHIMYGVSDHGLVAAWAGDKPVAIITVDNLLTGRAINEEHMEALRLFAGYAGMAIENSRLNEALQTQLGQRQTLIDELETKNAELERFTYTVSHDLKSPLVTITGFLGYLEQDASSGNVERVKSGIDRISRAAKKMQALLNDLLELSRVGRIMNSPEDVPFEEIVNEAIDHVRGQLDELDAIVELQSEYPVVHGDKVRLVEVLQNLIDNAVKYSNPNVKPRIEIGTNGQDEDGYTIFYVRDNGIGIEEQYHDNIFGLFNKLDAQSEGTGIGLSLVKRIIEVHNGRIWVESEKDKGTVFYFSLPTPQTKE